MSIRAISSDFPSRNFLDRPLHLGMLWTKVIVGGASGAEPGLDTIVSHAGSFEDFKQPILKNRS
jgi:hypothetical protein